MAKTIKLDDSSIAIPWFSDVCTTCIHVDSMERTCKAFPGGIPLAIWLGHNDHTAPFPGDNGIMFEARPVPSDSESTPQPITKARRGDMKPGHKYTRREWNAKRSEWEYVYHGKRRPSGGSAQSAHQGGKKFVVRNTFTPHYDSQRNWSAWIGGAWDTEREAVEALIDDGSIEVEPSWFGLRRRDFEDDPTVDDIYHRSDCSDWESFLDIVMQHADPDIRYNEQYKKWQHVHHEGLSCYPLTSDTKAGAIREAHAALKDNTEAFPWHGFGHRTHGAVKPVHQLSDTLWLFEADDTSPESDY